VGYLKHCVLTLALAAVIVATGGCEEKVLNEPPLLLEESTDTQELAPPSGPVADNSRCHVCHLNYAVEELAVVHGRANIGCEQCHGSSDAHCSDEDNVTPPDIMFPMEKINSFCKSCHADAKLGGGKKYCTDCHGDHRLGHRTRRWDKSTGELIEDDEVRMMTDEMLKQK
jgi:hypothetical protein